MSLRSLLARRNLTVISTRRSGAAILLFRRSAFVLRLKFGSKSSPTDSDQARSFCHHLRKRTLLTYRQSYKLASSPDIFSQLQSTGADGHREDMVTVIQFIARYHSYP